MSVIELELARVRTRWDWSDGMIAQIKQIVGPLMLGAAPLDMDQNQNTDLCIIAGRDIRIAARVRGPGYFEKYPYEVTIRSHGLVRAEVEISKIMAGLGDWFFYGHANDQDKIHAWWLIDLAVFRNVLNGHKHGTGPKIDFSRKVNKDGTEFVAFDLRSFPAEPSVLVASSHPLPLKIDHANNR